VKAAKTAKGRSVRLPSPALKADKTAKTANGFVTLVTLMPELTGLVHAVIGIAGASAGLLDGG